MSYWQPHDNSELGIGIVASSENIVTSEKHFSNEADADHLYAHLKILNNKVTYYVGFGWKESEQFVNKEAWEDYLSLFTKQINNPLIIEYVGF